MIIFNINLEDNWTINRNGTYHVKRGNYFEFESEPYIHMIKVFPDPFSKVNNNWIFSIHDYKLTKLFFNMFGFEESVTATNKINSIHDFARKKKFRTAARAKSFVDDFLQKYNKLKVFL